MKLKKALLGLALTTALVLPVSASTLRVNGHNIWNEAQAQVIHNTTYVSLRMVTQILAPDAQISWSGGAARATASGLDLTAVPGQNYLTVNDRALYIPDGVRAANGRVMVPIRVLAKALGGSVDWSREAGVTLTVGSGRPGSPSYTQDDLYWMSRIISAESQGESLLGKIAVGTVILNRVASDEFPNDIRSVIFDREWGVQFTPVANGTIYHEPTAESVLAAKLCLEGARAAGDSLYFLAPKLSSNHWIINNRQYVTTIGAHQFYR